MNIGIFVLLFSIVIDSMAPSVDSVCERIRDTGNSGFDLSDDIEELVAHAETHEQLLCAMRDRIEQDPGFREDLDDLGIFQVIMDNFGTQIVLLDVLSSITGNHRGLRIVLGSSSLVTCSIFNALRTSLSDHSYHQHQPLFRFVNGLCRGISHNKKRFLSLVPDLVTSLSRPTQTCPVIMFELLSTLLADDDQICRSDPSSVMVRNSILEDDGLTKIRMILKLYRDVPDSEPIVLSLLNELSCSQTYSYAFAIEDGYLDWIVSILVASEDPQRLARCIRLLRTWSFSDNLKEAILDVFLRTSDAIIRTTMSDPKTAGHMFGMLANVSIRKPNVAYEIVNMAPRIMDVIERTVRTEVITKARTACMQFVRTLARSQQGKDSCGSLRDVCEAMSLNLQIPDTDRRCAREIVDALAKTELDGTPLNEFCSGN